MVWIKRDISIFLQVYSLLIKVKKNKFMWRDKKLKECVIHLKRNLALSLSGFFSARVTFVFFIEQYRYELFQHSS